MNKIKIKYVIAGQIVETYASDMNEAHNICEEKDGIISHN